MMHFRVATPLTTLGVTMDGDTVTAIRFHDESGEPPPTPAAREVARQLHAYAVGELTAFDVPVRPHGTPFQQRVWRALLDIPYGETRTYGEVAASLGRPTAARAVGLANGRNPIPIIIPCHRVIGADGSLTGFGGGLALKRRLLALEGVQPEVVQLALL